MRCQFFLAFLRSKDTVWGPDKWENSGEGRGGGINQIILGSAEVKMHGKSWEFYPNIYTPPAYLPDQRTSHKLTLNLTFWNESQRNDCFTVPQPWLNRTRSQVSVLKTTGITPIDGAEACAPSTLMGCGNGCPLAVMGSPHRSSLWHVALTCSGQKSSKREPCEKPVLKEDSPQVPTWQ